MPKTTKAIVGSIRPPRKETLRSYGLTEDCWKAMCLHQRGLCPVCGEPFGERALAIDHEHVRGFKAKKVRKGRKVRAMPPEERRRHVRGILHAWCNRFVRAWLTLPRCRLILAYLEAHERRKKSFPISSPNPSRMKRR